MLRFSEEEKREDYKDIEEMLRKNMSYSQIASVLGRSSQYVGTVRKKLAEDGVLTDEELKQIKASYTEKKLKERDEKVLAYLKEGCTKNEIFEKYKITQKNINESIERLKASGIDVSKFKTKTEMEKKRRKDIILTLLKDGHNIVDIIDETKFPRSTVEKLVNELISEEKVKKEDIKTYREVVEELVRDRNNQIKELAKTGLSRYKIADIVGVSDGTVYYVIHGLKTPYKPRKRKDTKIKEVDDSLTKEEKTLIDYLKIGYSYDTISRLLNITRPDLMQLIKNLKHKKYVNKTMIKEGRKNRKEYYKSEIKRLLNMGYNQAEICRFLNKDVEEIPYSGVSVIVRGLQETGEVTIINDDYKTLDDKVLVYLKSGYTIKEIVNPEKDKNLTFSKVVRSRKRLINDGIITEEEIMENILRKRNKERETAKRKDEKIIWSYLVKEGLKNKEIAEKSGYPLHYVMSCITSVKERKNLTVQDTNRLRKEAKERIEKERLEALTKEKNNFDVTLKKYKEVKRKVKRLMNECIDNISTYTSFFNSLQEMIEHDYTITKEDIDILSYIVLYTDKFNKINYASYVVNLYLNISEYLEAERFLNMFYQYKRNEIEFYYAEKKKIKKHQLKENN